MEKFNLFIRFPHAQDLPSDNAGESLRIQTLYLKSILADLEARLLEEPWRSYKLSSVIFCGGGWWTPFEGFHREVLNLLQSMQSRRFPPLIEYRVSPGYLDFLLQTDIPFQSLICMKLGSFCNSSLRELGFSHSARDALAALQKLKQSSYRFALEMRLDAIQQSPSSFKNDIVEALFSNAERIQYSGVDNGSTLTQSIIEKKRRTLISAFSCTNYQELSFELFAMKPYIQSQASNMLGIGSGAFSQFTQLDGKQILAENLAQADRYIDMAVHGGWALDTCSVLEGSVTETETESVANPIVNDDRFEPAYAAAG